jgi:urea transport system ATP-binding protein
MTALAATATRDLHLVASQREAAGTIEPVLALHDAAISYGESVVVEGAGLEVGPGQVVCLMGRNGAGKTTLMKSIMGTLPLRRGSISLFGRDVRRWPAYRRARAGIGYVPQGRGIFPYLSVLDNLHIGLEPVQGRDSGQIEEVLTLFPVLRQMAGRPAGLLSGGQQQQLAIARALVGRPRLLLLDEPTEGIQPSIVEEIEQVIASLRGRLSVLLVEQFLDFALGVADHCYVLESGRVVLDGAPEQLDEAALKQYLAV